jgi:proline dehydrogenase
MLTALSKAAFHGLASSRTLQKIASRYGMRKPSSFARRFIAGESVEDAIAAARTIEARGMTVTLDYLGESVSRTAEADAATRDYLDIIRKVAASGIGRNLSIKLTQIGLDIDRATCVDNLRRLLNATQPNGFFVRIDMESSAYTEVTLQVFQTVWEQGYREIGVVLQSALRRSVADMHRLNRLGARIRLVKGAYKEPVSVAYQKKGQVDAAFVRMMRVLLIDGTYPAIATHDPAMIGAACAFAAERNVPRDRFEFQMLYGVRRDLQAALTADGYPFRVYIPFGRDWFPYFMRRLGERPANLLFVARSLVRER